ncbi:MAG: Gfo/Idh/MocA family oxidoreductase [Candidatus Omnitrophica bacterium]|nr:Gfo/Idh/MocA family oxidoreductase [Candidatus Omnitrophota bacterium]
MSNTSVTRRDFMKSSSVVAGAGLTFPHILPASAKGANDRVTLASIGVGGKGQHGMGIFHKFDDVEFVAVCDVYQPNMEAARNITEGRAEMIKDFRDVLAREDLDAVHISTPDHWHAEIMIQACAAGKDVYVEKPVSLTIGEGRRMVEAAKKHNRVVQCGTQQRSGTHFQKAVEIVASGGIGEVTMTKTWILENESPNGIGNPPNQDPPADLDWEMWQGPSPRHEYNPNRFRQFRWFWDYSGGKVTDWGVHLMDIVQWAMGMDAPLNVCATGGKYSLKDNRETPDTVHVTWEYPGFLATFTNRVCNAHPEDGDGYGIQFHGTEGTLYVNRGGWTLTPETGPDNKPRIPAQSSGGSEQNGPHERQFIDCVKSREKPISDIETTHRSTSACLMANIALKTGQRLEWDPVHEKFTNSDEANELLDYEYSKPWGV